MEYFLFLDHCCYVFFRTCLYLPYIWFTNLMVYCFLAFWIYVPAGSSIGFLFSISVLFSSSFVFVVLYFVFGRVWAGNFPLSGLSLSFLSVAALQRLWKSLLPKIRKTKTHLCCVLCLFMLCASS